ncbi:2102_t:CDS:2 [Ambispora gerdemannii]|uniref:2102_t:CDS:1 n=1 Tax=Ambispora gerdemannii TaxID=144530 RepID=A0A9N9BLQ0_9GLOM|nr:2102_t:CDS:2 [Ambispora gerdemannii]
MSIVNKNLPRSASTPSPSGSNSAAHTPLASPVDFISNTPTSLTRVLTYTSPFVHSFSHFLSLVTWQTNNPAESCLLVAAWWTLCLFPRELLVYGTHIILIGWIAWRWIEKGKRERLGKPNPIARSVSQLDLNQTVEEIHKISEKLSNFHGIVKDLDSHINWSNPSQTQIVILGLLYSYPVWIVLNFLISLKWIFLVTGTVVLVWNGPWFRVIRYSLMQSPLFRGTVSFLIGFIWGGRLKQEGVRGFSVASLIRKAKEQQKKLIARKASKDDSKTSTTDLIFRFVLYENQRWWLGLDWTTNLFPNERAPWSDEYNEPTNNKNSFQLPPPTTSLTASPNEPNMLIRKTEEWRWADSDWWLDLEGDVDKDGWEYADNRWKSFTSKGGFHQNGRLSQDGYSVSKQLPRISRGPDGKFELNGIQNLNPVVTPKSDLNERNTSIVYEKELHNLF